MTDTIINPGHNQVLGTDSFDDAEKSFGPEYFEYRGEWNDYPKKRIVNDFPLHIDIEATDTCNLKCIMCPRNYLSGKTGHIGWELFQKVIDEGAENHLPSIKLNYRGEPLLHPRLAEMVAYAKKKGIIETQFNTNGLLLTEDKITELIDAGLDRIIFSVDGATRETYEKIRLGSDYNRVVDNIKTFVKIRNEKGLKRPLVRVQMVKMKENEDEVEDFLKMWMPVANRMAVSVERQPIESGDETEHFPCPQIWQRLMVCWNGEVRMCCGDWEGEVVLGNANESTIYELWHGEKINRIRELHSQGRFNEVPVCARCPINTPRIDSGLFPILELYQKERR